MTAATVTDTGRPTLVRVIGRWTLTAIVINSVIGSGIFGLPSTVAGLVGAWSPLAVLIAGACIFVVVLCFAEVGNRFDQAGGPYLYAREAFGPGVGFQIGWLHIWTRLLSAAAVLNVLVAYVSALVPAVALPFWRAVVMTGSVLLFMVINVVGVRQASWTVNLFTIAKLLPLGLLLALGLFQVRDDVLATQVVGRAEWTDAILVLIFAYGGFESAAIAAGEMRDPKRDTAFAIVLGMAFVTLIYSLVQLAVVGVLPRAAAEKAPIAAALGQLLGPVGITVGGVAVILSVYGWLSGFALSSPRILFAMAERGELPASFGSVHERYRTPHVSIVVNCVVALALGLYSNFAQAATFSVVTRLVIFATTCAAVVVFRRRWGPAPGLLLPGGPLFPALGIAFCIWMLSTRSLAEAWLLPVIVGAGVALWVLRPKR